MPGTGRRRFVVVLAVTATIALVGVATGVGAAPIPSDECTQVGTLEGTAGPELADSPEWNASDSYDTEIYHCPEEVMPNAFVRGAATVGSNGDDVGEIYLSEVFYGETAFVLYHERGHNLGYGHDDGLMDYDKPDADPAEPLHEESKAIAEHTEGLRYVDWSEDGLEMVRFVIDEWRAGNTTLSELEYAIDRWRVGEGDDIYADNTIVEELEGDLPTYEDDSEERGVRSNAFYRNETTGGGEAWR